MGEFLGGGMGEAGAGDQLWPVERACSIITPCHTGERIGLKNRQCEVWWCQREGGWAAKENMVCCGHQAGMGYDSVRKTEVISSGICGVTGLEWTCQDIWPQGELLQRNKTFCVLQLYREMVILPVILCSVFLHDCLGVANGSHYMTSLH